MYIRRKVFSLISDENGEERLFSTTEFVDEETYLNKIQREFSEEEEKRTKLKHVQSHRGLGRSVAISGLLGQGAISGALGGYAGKKAANKADEAGASDEEIMKAAKSKATKVGAGIGAASGLAGGAVAAQVAKKYGNAIPKKQLAALTAGATVAGALWGGVGARAGASKNTKERLMKRKYQDSDK